MTLSAAGSPRANSPFIVAGSVIVVTGGASGIGAALARRFTAGGAAAVVIADLDQRRCEIVAERISAGGRGVVVEGRRMDVTDSLATEELIVAVEGRHGPIDLWCANAGVGTAAGADAPLEQWQHTWEVNLLAHVHAVRSMLPRWLERGRGHLLVTASAAGLLTNIGDAPYSVTKHAAVAFAEWLAITHGTDGIAVSCLCPQGVRTPMLFGAAADIYADSAPDGADPVADAEGAAALEVVRAQRVLEADQVAAAVADGLADGRFLILPHEEVAGYEAARATDHDRWIQAMRRLQTTVAAPADPPR